MTELRHCYVFPHAKNNKTISWHFIFHIQNTDCAFFPNIVSSNNRCPPATLRLWVSGMNPDFGPGGGGGGRLLAMH